MTNERLENLIKLECLQEKLTDLIKNVKLMETKRIKLKDLMNILKEGKAQKDLDLWHYFEDSIFLKLSRKDSVGIIEKEMQKFQKNLIADKKSIEDHLKQVNKLIEMSNGLITLKDVDYDIGKLMLVDDL
jgi:hypothetical protein